MGLFLGHSRIYSRETGPSRGELQALGAKRRPDGDDDRLERTKADTVNHRFAQVAAEMVILHEVLGEFTNRVEPPVAMAAGVGLDLGLLCGFDGHVCGRRWFLPRGRAPNRVVAYWPSSSK